MTPKARIKLAVDIFMTFAMLFLMGYHLWGEAAHEWAGAIMLLLLIVHHILNRSWYKNLFKNRFSPMGIFQSGVNILLLIAMLAEMYSGIVMSRYVFSFLPMAGGMALARRLHILGAYWGFILMSVHLGLHWNMVLGIFRKKAGMKKASRIPTAICFTIGAVVAAYGGYAFIKRDFLTCLLLRTEFVFLDYGELPILFYMDYTALMALCIFTAHYTAKLCRRLQNRNVPLPRLCPLKKQINF